MAAKDTNKWIITVSVMVPTLLEILDTSIANVALGHIQGSLSAGQDEVTWVLTSYLVSNAVVIPMSGWLSRVMGRRTYLMASVAMFVLSSMLCGLAGSLGSLVFFRVVQGIGGGGLQPMSQAILLETFPPAQRGLAMAIFAMGAVLGPILGPLIGGYITDNYSWRWIFFINVPIGALALFMIWSFVQDPPYLERRSQGEGIDYPGLILLTLGLGCLQIVLDKGQQEDWMESASILALAIVSGVSLVGLVFRELWAKNPVVDLRAFKDRSFATGNAVMFFGFFAFFGSIVMLPLFLQNLMGYTAFLAGVVLGPGGLIMLLLLPLVGKLTQKVDPRLLLSLGMAVSAYSLFGMSGFSLQVDMDTAIMARNIQAIGISCFFVPLSFLTMAYVPREKMNNASAIFNLLRNPRRLLRGGLREHASGPAVPVPPGPALRGPFPGRSPAEPGRVPGEGLPGQPDRTAGGPDRRGPGRRLPVPPAGERPAGLFRRVPRPGAHVRPAHRPGLVHPPPAPRGRGRARRALSPPE